MVSLCSTLSGTSAGKTKMAGGDAMARDWNRGETSSLTYLVVSRLE